MWLSISIVSLMKAGCFWSVSDVVAYQYCESYEGWVLWLVGRVDCFCQCGCQKDGCFFRVDHVGAYWHHGFGMTGRF